MSVRAMFVRRKELDFKAPYVTVLTENLEWCLRPGELSVCSHIFTLRRIKRAALKVTHTDNLATSALAVSRLLIFSRRPLYWS